jgi:predicted SAM-dependent methyltransferase
MKTRLNLGCGNDIRKNWENYDKYPTNKTVRQLDLTTLPLPFPSSYADEILLHGVYEHLHVNHYEFMQELSRILKKDGKMTIIVRGYKNNFDHEQFLFRKGYFDCSVKPYNLFKTVTCRTTPSNFRRTMYNLKTWLDRMRAKEFIYEFKK